MNLFDIVSRKDSCLIVEKGSAVAGRCPAQLRYRGVLLAPSARIRLTGAHTFLRIQEFPRAPAWILDPVFERGREPIRISLIAADGRHHVLFPTTPAELPPPFITLDWPGWAGFTDGFDLIIENVTQEDVFLGSTWLFNPRENMRPFLIGQGVEVGPGSNPYLRPADGVNVKYIEQSASAADWQQKYGKTAELSSLMPLWDSYVAGDATTLDVIEDGSLDFVFSSHVFEHLVNPIGVLQNWSRKLKAGGVVAAVIPDARFCFDLRQPPSSPAEWEAEYERGAHGLERSHFERWCRYTAPTADPVSLMKRGYSVHAHYYTSDSIRLLADAARRRGWFDQAFLNAAPNNKDFGIVLRRSTASRPEGATPSGATTV